MPSLVPIDAIPYDEWVEHVLGHPLFTRDGSFVAIVDGRAAAISLPDREPGARTRRQHVHRHRPRVPRPRPRARRQARLDRAGPRRTASPQLVTTNDETNAPMLAINRRLGYQPAGRRVEYLRSNGNGFFASAASTCEVTQTGVVTYCVE